MKPSVIYGQPDALYRAIKALSASGAFTLIGECPRLFYATSPWNPDYREPPKTAFDIGTAAHLAVLEPERVAESVVVIEAADYKTTRARELRDAAHAEGRVPLLWEQWKMVERMARVLHSDPRAAALLDGAQTEVSFYWEDGRVECKARADIVTADGAIVDLKTLGSASPAFFQRQAANFGWDMRADWYSCGWRLCAHTERPVPYKFLVIGKDEPHLVEIYEVAADEMEAAHILNQRAVEMLARCIERDEWPGYGGGADSAPVALPRWARWQRRIAAGLGADYADMGEM